MTLHYCPQCHHVGPPKRGPLNWIGWLLLAATALLGIAVAGISAQEAANYLAVADAATPHLTHGDQVVVAVASSLLTLAAFLAVPGMLIWLSRPKVCGACGSRHTRRTLSRPA